MKYKHLRMIIGSFFIIMVLVVAGCSGDKSNQPDGNQNVAENQQGNAGVTNPPELPPVEDPMPEPKEDTPDDSEPTTGEPAESPYSNPDGAIQVVVEPTDVAVLVNKFFKLPEGHTPDELVYPDVPFIFDEMVDKRKMRKEAAEALEKMFAAAKEDDIHLAGASGYRSEATQAGLFNTYVERDGLEAASRYSARPGHSEHQTGLAMDVSGISGTCAVMDCFAGEVEAKWLDKHAPEYGFIIRYPQGKEDITGYKYEPWHLRYVGVDIAAEIHGQGITLEEYYNAVPVSNEGS